MSEVYAFLSWQFWWFAVVFLGVLILMAGLGSFLVPRSRLTTDRFETLAVVVLQLGLGLGLFTLTGWLFAWGQVRFLQWGVVGLGFWGARRTFRHQSALSKTSSNRPQLAPALGLWGWLIGIGSLLQIVAVAGSGWLDDQTIRYYFTNSQDGMMHLAFAQGLTQTFPPIRPEIFTQTLKNYHYLGDLLLAEQNRLFSIPINHLFFHYSPILLAVGIGIILVAILRRLSTHSLTTTLGLWLWYGSGELSHVWYWLIHRGFNWKVATIENSADQFLNMPQMWAKFLVFTALYALLLFHQSKRWYYLVAAVGLIAVSTGFKIYFGVFMMAVLGAVGLSYWWRFRTELSLKTQLQSLGIGVMGLLFTLGIIKSVDTTGSSLYFVPLAWPHLLLGLDHLHFERWSLLMQVYQAAQSFKGIWALNGLALLIGVTSMLGIKILGIVPLLKPSRWWFGWPLLLAIVSSLFVGLNFLQSPGGFNTYNFVVITTPLLLLSTAVWLGTVWNTSRVGPTLVGGLLLLSMGRPLANLWNYSHIQSIKRSDATYPPAYLESFAWIAQNLPQTATIQALPENERNRQSAFLSFFTKRQTFLAGENNAVSHGLAYFTLEDQLRTASKGSTAAVFRENFKKLGIDYLYVEKIPPQTQYLELEGIRDQVVFENATIAIIKL